jgi:hypothetical protein
VLLGATLPWDDRITASLVTPERMIIAVLLTPILNPSQGLAIRQACQRVHAAGVQTEWAGAPYHARIILLGNCGHHFPRRLLAFVAPGVSDDGRMMALTADLMPQLTLLICTLQWQASAMSALRVHQIHQDHDSFLVARIRELSERVDATAP